MAGVKVTLWRTAGEESPESLRKATTDSNGRFAFHVVMGCADGNVFYLTTRGDARRSAPFVPYLAYTPPDFAMILKFAGGGVGVGDGAEV